MLTKDWLNYADIPGLEWIGLRFVRELTSERYVRDGKPQSNSAYESTGVMVEVLCNGQFGYAATQQMNAEGITRAVQQAKQQAEGASRFAVYSFTPTVRPPVKSRYASVVQIPFQKKSAGEINSFLVRACEKLKQSPKIIKTGAVARLVETETSFISSNGSDAEQKFSLLTTGFEATAQDGPIVQRRTDGGFRNRSYQGGLEYLETPDAWERVDRVAQEVLELVAAEDCPTETTSLVLKPDQMMLQIHESIGHPLEIDRILGDERNYAGWSFVKLEDFGQLQYGSPLMNVTFDPTISNQFATYAFDDTGNTATRQWIIEKGKLVRGLGSLESQTRSGLEGVANQRACLWNRPAIDRMANLNLEPGTSSWDDIISSVDDGILMEANRSWSIDDFRNKFQFGCEYAKKIKNGKITKTLRNPNYRGVTVPFWNNLKMVGNRDTFETYGTPYCGKGEPNQIIRVGHASPACLFENIEVFGGGA